jgi:nucleoid DNA-binding protein
VDDAIIAALGAELGALLAAGKSVTIDGLGQWTSREYAAYKGRDPRSGAVIDVPAKRLPFLRVDRALIEGLDAGTAVPRFKAPAVLVAKVAHRAGSDAARIEAVLDASLKSVLGEVMRTNEPQPFGGIGIFLKHRKRVSDRLVVAFAPSCTWKAVVDGRAPPPLVDPQEIDEMLGAYPEAGLREPHEVVTALNRIAGRAIVPRELEVGDDVAWPPLVRTLVEHTDDEAPGLLGVELIDSRDTWERVRGWRDESFAIRSRTDAARWSPFAADDGCCWCIDGDSSMVVFIPDDEVLQGELEFTPLVEWLTACIFIAELEDLVGYRALARREIERLVAYVDHVCPMAKDTIVRLR